MTCFYTTSKVLRCVPHIENGDVGDPWIPVERHEGALTVGPKGFHYELLSRLLLSNEYRAFSGADNSFGRWRSAVVSRGRACTWAGQDRRTPRAHAGD